MEQVNPVLPTGYDALWTIAICALAALMLVALVTAAMSARRLPLSHTILWLVVILAVPVVGAVAWLAVGLPRSRSRHDFLHN